MVILDPPKKQANKTMQADFNLSAKLPGRGLQARISVAFLCAQVDYRDETCRRPVNIRWHELLCRVTAAQAAGSTMPSCQAEL